MIDAMRVGVIVKFYFEWDPFFGAPQKACPKGEKEGPRGGK